MSLRAPPSRFTETNKNTQGTKVSRTVRAAGSYLYQRGNRYAKKTQSTRVVGSQDNKEPINQTGKRQEDIEEDRKKHTITINWIAFPSVPGQM